MFINPRPTALVPSKILHQSSAVAIIELLHAHARRLAVAREVQVGLRRHDRVDVARGCVAAAASVLVDPLGPNLRRMRCVEVSGQVSSRYCKAVFPLALQVICRRRMSVGTGSTGASLHTSGRDADCAGRAKEVLGNRRNPSAVRDCDRAIEAVRVLHLYQEHDLRNHRHARC